VSVAVITFDPPLRSATVKAVAVSITQAPSFADEAHAPAEVPVVHEVIREPLVLIDEVMDMVSPAPKPVTHTIAGWHTVPAGKTEVGIGTPTLWPGKPCRPLVAITRAGLIVNGALTVVVPSVTVIVCAPPGNTGTLALTWKVPEAVVVRQPPEIKLS